MAILCNIFDTPTDPKKNFDSFSNVPLLSPDTIWVIVQVDSGGTLALMQQMVNLKELGGSPPPTSITHTTTTTNPFAPTHTHPSLHQPNGNLIPPILPSSPPRPLQDPSLGMQGPMPPSLPNQDDDTGMS